MLKIYASSKAGLYDALAIYDAGLVTVLKGSRINMRQNPKFKPSKIVSRLRSDRTEVNEKGILERDIEFSSLSSAATFVTGRTANGMTAWKTEDGKYVRYSVKSNRSDQKN